MGLDMLSVIFGFIIFFLLFFVIVFSVGRIFKNKLLLVKSWASPYECGFSSNSIRLNCFSFTYFSLLVFFVVFDLEISLLLNMPEQGLLYSNFVYYYFFLIVLGFGFVLEVFFGYVRWGY